MFKSICAVIGLFALGTVALAGEAPAAAPAPASRPADQSTPKGALKVFMQAISAAEAEKVRACLHTTSEIEVAYAQGYGEVSIALGRLRNVLVAKFGEKAAKEFQASSGEEQMRRVDEGSEEIKGETAVVEMKGIKQGERPTKMHLVRVGEVWKLAVGRMVAGKPAREVRTEVERMKIYSTLVSQTADEVAAGKHATFEAAMDALKNKLEGKAGEKK